MTRMMKMEKLSRKDSLVVSVMLFGMFFGAGNLIFPALMGQEAGYNVWKAVAGFIITGVGMPLLCVAALGISRSDGLQALADKVGKKYSIFFTCALYLTIGPFFAIPRCASTSFTVGITPLVHSGNEQLLLAIFTLLFFAIVLFFSLRPGKILVWVGRVLTPVFLVFLGVLVVAAVVNPAIPCKEVIPSEAYTPAPFFKGFLEGYNTMDVLAGLAFGIVVVNVIRGLGVTEPKAVASATVRAGIGSCIIMAVIYIFVTLAGVHSRGYSDVCANGGLTLSAIAGHYFGAAGQILLAITVTLACLKTAIGLVTSCGEAFVKMFPKGPGYRTWAIVFSVFSLLISNVGLNAIVSYSIPVLMFLYPLAISLMLLALFGRFFDYDRNVFVCVTVFTLIAAVFDFCSALPAGIKTTLHLDLLTAAASKALPFFSLGLGWVIPALVGLTLGFILRYAKKKKV